MSTCNRLDYFDTIRLPVSPQDLPTLHREAAYNSHLILFCVTLSSLFVNRPCLCFAFSLSHSLSPLLLLLLLLPSLSTDSNSLPLSFSHHRSLSTSTIKSDPHPQNLITSQPSDEATLTQSFNPLHRRSHLLPWASATARQIPPPGISPATETAAPATQPP